MLFLQRSKKGVYAHLGFFKVFIIKSWRSVPVESVYSKEPSARIQPKIKQKPKELFIVNVLVEEVMKMGTKNLSTLNTTAKSKHS